LAKGDKGRTVLESAAFHFVQQDLLHHLVDVYGFKNLMDQEKEVVSVLCGAAKPGRGNGCLGIVFVFISFMALVVLIISKL